jgi:hypothetical protein
MLTRTPESPPHSSRLAPQCSAATAAATAAASDADAIARADMLPAQQSAASLATSSAPPATATATAGSAATARELPDAQLQPQHGQGDVCLYVRTRPGSVSCPFHVFLRIFKKNMLQKWPFLRCGGGRILAGFC